MNILRYPGGKSRRSVREKIISHFPEFSELRIPFVGGGGIYFNIDPSTVKKRLINDIHSGLIAVYRALRDRPEEFIRLCREITPDNLQDKFNEVKHDFKCDQALRYFLINRVNWAGRVNYNIPSRMYFSNPTGWNIINTDKLEKAADHIKGTDITCTDFEDHLTEPGEDVLVYCDPPYVLNTEMAKTDQQYQHNFSMDDHEELAEFIVKCKHKVCLSYDDHELVRNLYKDFNIHATEWKYAGSSLSKKKTGRELIITNY